MTTESMDETSDGDEYSTLEHIESDRVRLLARAKCLLVFLTGLICACNLGILYIALHC